MTISVQSAFSNSAASGGQTSGSVTMPTIAAGDQAFLLVSHSLASASVAVTNPGWSAGTVLTFASQSATLFTKTLAGSESGASVSATFTSGRWAIALVVVSGADTPESSTTTDGANEATIPLGTLTPTFANALLLALSGASLNATATPGITPPSGWTEVGDTYTSNGTGRISAAWAGTKQLATGAGVASPAAAATPSVTANSGTWLLAFKETTAPPSLVVGQTYQLVGGVLV